MLAPFRFGSLVPRSYRMPRAGAQRRRGAAGLLASLAALLLSGCAIKPQDYAGTVPRFDMREFFDGPLEAWGMFQSRDGKVINRFHVTMVGSWSGDEGRLEEWFEYADGSKQERTWIFQRRDEHTYTGTAQDVIGQAQGTAFGSALNLVYTLALDVDGTTYHVRMDDWMFLIDDATVLNKTEMSKFGVRVGDVTLVIRKIPQRALSQSEGERQ